MKSLVRYKKNTINLFINQVRAFCCLKLNASFNLMMSFLRLFLCDLWLVVFLLLYSLWAALYMSLGLVVKVSIGRWTVLEISLWNVSSLRTKVPCVYWFHHSLLLNSWYTCSVHKYRVCRSYWGSLQQIVWQICWFLPWCVNWFCSWSSRNNWNWR